MSRASRNIALAAAAVVTLGTMALTANEASARPSGFHGGGGFHGGFHGGGFRVGMIRPRPILRPHWPQRHVFWRPHWRPRVVVAAPIIGAAAYTAYRAAAPIAPVTARTNCLTKEYTQEGAVLFKDNCTGEFAMNPPAADQAASQVQGGIQPQAQAN